MSKRKVNTLSAIKKLLKKEDKSTLDQVIYMVNDLKKELKLTSTHKEALGLLTNEWQSMRELRKKLTGARISEAHSYFYDLTKWGYASYMCDSDFNEQVRLRIVMV